jgi:hypothetical protein
VDGVVIDASEHMDPDLAVLVGTAANPRAILADPVAGFTRLTNYVATVARRLAQCGTKEPPGGQPNWAISADRSDAQSTVAKQKSLHAFNDGR